MEHTLQVVEARTGAVVALLSTSLARQALAQPRGSLWSLDAAVNVWSAALSPASAIVSAAALQGGWVEGEEASAGSSSSSVGGAAEALVRSALRPYSAALALATADGMVRALRLSFSVPCLGPCRTA